MGAGLVAVMHAWLNGMQIIVITVLLYHLFLCLRGFSHEMSHEMSWKAG